MFCHFSENDQSNWKVDQSPEDQRYVFSKRTGPPWQEFMSLSDIFGLEVKLLLQTCLCVPEQVLTSESRWVCIVIKN